MVTTINSKPLTLKIAGFGEFSVVSFDGTSGTAVLIGSPNLPTYCQGSLFQQNATLPLWEGTVETNEGERELKFHLCITPHFSHGSKASIRWSEIDDLLTLSSGGYEAIPPDSFSKLLNDFYDFKEVLETQILFAKECKRTNRSVKLNTAEPLTNVSELLFDWIGSWEPIENEQPIVLVFTIFEISICVVAFCEESSSEGIIVSLTEHTYYQLRRAGRRVITSDLFVDQMDIQEVSDFGCRVASIQHFGEIGNTVNITFKRHPVKFEIIHSSKRGELYFYGLALAESESSALTEWTEVLLKYQYPLLRRRTVETQSECWNLLERSGYLENDFGKFLSEAKEPILEEWKKIDLGPCTDGSAVVGTSLNELVSTIGVSKVTDEIWVAQAAAVLDRPEYLPFTRSMYGWRTRAILQNQRAQLHVAFFHRDKPFLDRFFRKFYLNEKETAGPKLIWSEWKYYAQKLPESPRMTPAEIEENNDKNGNTNVDPFLNQLNLYSPNLIGKSKDGKTFEISLRPHLHLCQYFTSIWISNDVLKDDTSLDELIATIKKFSEKSESFFTIRDQTEEDNSLIESLRSIGPIVYDGWEVAWLCHRDLLPKFLANSLKSLEIMFRKYGIRSVA